MKKTKTVKAKRMWLEDGHAVKGQPNLVASRPVFVLPATQEDYEQMVEQGAVAIAELRNWKGAFYTDCPPNVRDGYRADARAVLSSLGLLPLKGGK